MTYSLTHSLTYLLAYLLIGQVRSTGAEAEIIDVERRTALADEQGATIIIEGAHSVSLDSLVEGGAYMPDAETAIVLTCDRGPKVLSIMIGSKGGHHDRVEG